MTVTMTESAARQVAEQAAKNNGIGLRLGVKKSGCTGFAYDYAIATEIADGDSVFEAFGAKLVVPSDSIEFLSGSELDYVREGLGKIFKVRNPNVTATCGCGESFAVERP